MSPLDSHISSQFQRKRKLFQLKPFTNLPRGATQAEDALNVVRIETLNPLNPPPYNLYVALHNHSDMAGLDEYRRSFHLQKSLNDGYKYGLRKSKDGWVADHGPKTGILRTTNLVVLIRIATISTQLNTQLDAIMRSCDGKKTHAHQADLLWAMTILRMLAGNGFVACSNTTELRNEFLTLGNSHLSGGFHNRRPRPVISSPLCFSGDSSGGRITVGESNTTIEETNATVGESNATIGETGATVEETNATIEEINTTIGGADATTRETNATGIHPLLIFIIILLFLDLHFS